MTYAGCNHIASPGLRAVAFRSYTECRMFPFDMGEQRIYLKEWRKHRGLTQREVVDRLAGMDDPMLPATEASLSRLENGKQPYSQRVLEALAHIYSADPEHLIGRHPEKEGDVIDLWSVMNDNQRRQAKAVLEALLKDAG